MSFRGCLYKSEFDFLTDIIIVSMIYIFHMVIKSSQLVAQSSHHRKSQNMRLIHTGSKLLYWFVVMLLLATLFVKFNYVTLCVFCTSKCFTVGGCACIPICSSADPIIYNLASLSGLAICVSGLEMDSNEFLGITS